MSTREIIARWLQACLENRISCTVFSHHFQTNVVSWAQRQFGILRNGATYDREWRKMRREQAWLSYGLVVRELTSDENPKTEKGWIIQRHVTPPRRVPPTKPPERTTSASRTMEPAAAFTISR